MGEVPNEVALSPTLDYAYSANVRSNSISRIDMSTFEVVDEILAGKGVHGVTVSHVGKQIWTTNNESNNVTVIDCNTFTILDTIDTGSYPNHISFSKDGKQEFVTHRQPNDLSVIDTKKRRVEKSLPLGKEPHEMTLKGLVEHDIERQARVDHTSNPNKEHIDGVDIEVKLLSPYVKEDAVKILDETNLDLFDYYALQINLTTHSGDLTALPWTGMISLTNGSGKKIAVLEWLVLNNDSHHPIFLAIFEKMMDQTPLLTSADERFI
ncbi:YncE family protein [Alkalihalobacterium elongatum]|uniref:YncE family protein n=1 Tax=Alkalihalobacterium elongatum TaxID=2675466 RepID=UPI001C1F621B|nr:YncE family protein [Alkalihalobacterium elongatum]